jgi:hypothetical protein
MAQTYENNDNVLSKVKLGNTTYYLKDAAARAPTAKTVFKYKE